ncbi:probable maltase-glucoamylase 2 isoform X2 [Scyliorhinus canicula]|uniref:probable maltase-glucoamylase 2 isoform X2 n=1 Tax=Scyliorhinus canicula TaxID=7830 RepID=UPI0018F50845|nr:probable maltase-glucoamylase 2 isoform X2 [Scyliorhinus canicula]
MGLSILFLLLWGNCFWISGLDTSHLNLSNASVRYFDYPEEITCGPTGVMVRIRNDSFHGMYLRLSIVDNHGVPRDLHSLPSNCSYATVPQADGSLLFTTPYKGCYVHSINNTISLELRIDGIDESKRIMVIERIPVNCTLPSLASVTDVSLTVIPTRGSISLDPKTATVATIPEAQELVSIPVATVPVTHVPANATVPVTHVPANATVATAPAIHVPFNTTVPVTHVPFNATVPVATVPVTHVPANATVPVATIPVTHVPANATVPVATIPVTHVPANATVPVATIPVTHVPANATVPVATVPVTHVPANATVPVATIPVTHVPANATVPVATVPVTHVPSSGTVPVATVSVTHVPANATVPVATVPVTHVPVPVTHVPANATVPVATVPVTHVPFNATVPVTHVPANATVPVTHVPFNATVPVTHVPASATVPVATVPVTQVPANATVPVTQVPASATVPVATIPVTHVPASATVPIATVPVTQVPANATIPVTQVPANATVPVATIPVTHVPASATVPVATVPVTQVPANATIPVTQVPANATVPVATIPVTQVPANATVTTVPIDLTPATFTPASFTMDLMPNGDKAYICDVGAKDRVGCGNASLGELACNAKGCCYDPADKKSPCFYGKTAYIDCTTNGLFTIVISKAATVPPLHLGSVYLLNNKSSQCVPLVKTTEFVIFRFPLDSCGATRMIAGPNITYKVDIMAKRKTQSGPRGSITRESTFRLHVICHLTGSRDLPLMLVVNTPSPLPFVVKDGVLKMEMRIAKDESYSTWFTDEDFPLVRLLREPVYVEVRLLHRADASIALLLNDCWATQTLDPRHGRKWSILVNGCPYYRDNYLTQLHASTPNLVFPTHHKRFEVKTFAFWRRHIQTQLSGEVYFHCSATVCVLSEIEECTMTCDAGKRIARNSDFNTSADALSETLQHQELVTLKRPILFALEGNVAESSQTTGNLADGILLAAAVASLMLAFICGLVLCRSCKQMHMS